MVQAWEYRGIELFQLLYLLVINLLETLRFCLRFFRAIVINFFIPSLFYGRANGKILPYDLRLGFLLDNIGSVVFGTGGIGRSTGTVVGTG